MITVVGSLNIDLFIEAPRLPLPGETVLGNRFRREPGGKGANQACAVAAMGSACCLIGAVGSDAFGEELIHALRARRVDTRAVLRRPHHSTGTAFIAVDASGQNSILVAPGANSTLSARDVTGAACIERSTAVVAQLETPLDSVVTALRLARQAGVMTVFNPAPGADAHSLAECLKLSDWVVPNEVEAAQLTGQPVRDVSQAMRAAESLRNLTGGANVAVTLGPLGVWVASDSFHGHCPAFAVDAVDTVGAGDAFIGALVARLVEGAPPQDAARFGCAAAALAVTRRGAQAALPTRPEVEALLAAGAESREQSSAR